VLQRLAWVSALAGEASANCWNLDATPGKFTQLGALNNVHQVLTYEAFDIYWELYWCAWTFQS
jgi:hypothetical protein